MSTSLTDKIAALEEKLANEEKALEGKIRTTIVVYAVLVLIVIGYTSFVVTGIKDLTSRTALAEQLSGWLNSSLPSQREMVVGHLKENTGPLVKSGVDYGLQTVMPTVEEQTKLVLDNFADMLASEMEERLVPAFTEFIEHDAERLKKNYAELKDDEVGEGLVLIFVSVLEDEMDNYLNDRFVAAVQDLQKRLHTLSKPTGELTKKQEAQRRALAHWAVLSEHADTGESVYYDLVMQIRDRFEEYVTDLKKPLVKDKADE